MRSCDFGLVFGFEWVCVVPNESDLQHRFPLVGEPCVYFHFVGCFEMSYDRPLASELNSEQELDFEMNYGCPSEFELNSEWELDFEMNYGCLIEFELNSEWELDFEMNYGCPIGFGLGFGLGLMIELDFDFGLYCLIEYVGCRFVVIGWVW